MNILSVINFNGRIDSFYGPETPNPEGFDNSIPSVMDTLDCASFLLNKFEWIVMHKIFPKVDISRTNIFHPSLGMF